MEIKIYYPVYLEVLVCIYKNNNNTVTDISKKTKITYCHISACIQKLERLKLIKSKKQGRLKLINLTEKGIYYSKFFFDFKNDYINVIKINEDLKVKK